MFSCTNKNIHENNKQQKNFCNRKISVDSNELICIGYKNLRMIKFLDFKNLETLILINSRVDSFKYLNKLNKIKKLILLNTNFQENDNLEIYEKLDLFYAGNYINRSFYSLKSYKNKGLMKYDNFIPLLFVNDSNKNKKIDLFKFKDNILEINDLKYVNCIEDIEELKIHLSNEKNLSLINSRSDIKKLYLSGNIKNIVKLPSQLEKLYLYNTNITNFSFLNNSKLKYLEIVTNNSLSNNLKKLTKTYPRIKINIKDSLFFSPTIYDSLNNKRIIDDSEIKKISSKYLKEKDNNFYFLNNLINTPKLKGAFIDVDYEEYKLLQELRKLIIDKDWRYLILTSNYILIKYLINHYDLDLNELDSNNKTLLDKLTSKVDEKIIHLLKQNGAKRACEILKTKCEPIKGDK
jgi:hypothetical protein